MTIEEFAKKYNLLLDSDPPPAMIFGPDGTILGTEDGSGQLEFIYDPQDEEAPTFPEAINGCVAVGVMLQYVNTDPDHDDLFGLVFRFDPENMDHVELAQLMTGVEAQTPRKYCRNPTGRTQEKQ